MNRFDHEAINWDKNKRRVDLAKTIANEIKKIIPLNKDYKILDFGCGTGLLSYNFKDNVKKIVGIDTSKNMVEEFNKKSDNKNIKAFKKTLKEIEENFDLIVSSMTFHHIKNIEKLIIDMKKILKNSGYICIADLEKEDGSFHDRGNEGVYHFGFDTNYLKNLFFSQKFKLIYEKRVYTIKKHKDFYIFLLCFKNEE